MLPAREFPPLVREKMTFLARHVNEYNTLFLGSSRMQAHVMPTVFDRDVADHDIHSFNAGVAGMYPPQDGWMLDQILALKPAKLRWVFVELQMLETTLPRTNRDSMQLLSWHDWPRYLLLCERWLTTHPHRHWRDRVEEFTDRWPDFCAHTVLFIRYYTDLGRGSALLQRRIHPESAPVNDWTLLGPDGDGFLPAVHALTKSEFAGLEGDMAKRRKSPPVRESADPISRQALASIVAKIRRAGATPVLVVPPTARGTYFAPAPKTSPGLIVLDFGQPQKYPELYDTKYRVDPSHLNAAGAVIFSHLLAAEFLKAVGTSP
ncbi:MAG TPA: hypothetical protein VGM54_11320 [Chthoniobacter sp.]